MAVANGTRARMTRSPSNAKSALSASRDSAWRATTRVGRKPSTVACGATPRRSVAKRGRVRGRLRQRDGSSPPERGWSRGERVVRDRSEARSAVAEDEVVSSLDPLERLPDRHRPRELVRLLDLEIQAGHPWTRGNDVQAFHNRCRLEWPFGPQEELEGSVGRARRYAQGRRGVPLRSRSTRSTFHPILWKPHASAVAVAVFPNHPSAWRR